MRSWSSSDQVTGLLMHSSYLKTSSSSGNMKLKEEQQYNDIALIAFKLCQRDSKLCGCRGFIIWGSFNNDSRTWTPTTCKGAHEENYICMMPRCTRSANDDNISLTTKARSKGHGFVAAMWVEGGKCSKIPYSSKSFFPVHSRRWPNHYKDHKSLPLGRCHYKVYFRYLNLTP